MTDSWIVIAAFLVFLMQAGFLLIEAGEVRAKNSISVAQKNVSDMLISVAAYALGGFGIMYGLSLGSFFGLGGVSDALLQTCLLYTSPSPRDQRGSRMPSSA